MVTVTSEFCSMIRARSDENQRAMNSFRQVYDVLSPAFSLLRQELDSMVRAIFLLNVEDLEERNRLMRLTLDGEKWNVRTVNGKPRTITDRDMVEVAQRLNGWTHSVYKFGCAFIHLSDFHNHHAEDPFQKLSANERINILDHMRYYHGGPLSDNPDMREIAKYVQMVFEKIASNLKCYLQDLEQTAG